MLNPVDLIHDDHRQEHSPKHGSVRIWTQLELAVGTGHLTWKMVLVEYNLKFDDDLFVKLV